MSRCEGTTKSGDQCKREAQTESSFCHMHGSREEPDVQACDEPAEWEDLVPLLLAGAATLGFVLLFKSVGRFIPKL